MSRTTSVPAALAAAFLVLFPPGARAQTAGATAEPVIDDDEFPLQLVVGIKFGAGSLLWTQPDDTDLHTFQSGPRLGETFDLPVFDEERTGYVLDTGFYIEGVLYKYLGLEVGLHFVQHNYLEDIDWSYTETFTDANGVTDTQTYEAKSKTELGWTALHLPILIKAVVPSGTTRVSLGVGPEFAFAQWDRSSFEVTEGELKGTRSAFKRVLPNLVDSVYLNVVFGIAILFEDFQIPIDLSWSYNFSQKNKYLERASVDQLPDDQHPDVHPTKLTINTRDSMYAVIRFGIAFQF